MRNIAIIFNQKSADIYANILSLLKNETVTIFYSYDVPIDYNKVDELSKSNQLKISTVELPNEVSSNLAKSKNYISSHFFESNTKGFLHIIESAIKINKDPYEFYSQIETAMPMLDYNIWFNTSSDLCNYVYHKFNPRLRLMLDINDNILNCGMGPELIYTSHSNASYVIYNLDKVSYEQVKFNDELSIPMFYIIEYLARRRNTKPSGSLYFMNMYLTVKAEEYLFSIISKPIDYSKAQHEKENKMFNELNVNYRPDNNIDIVLESTISMLKLHFEMN